MMSGKIIRAADVSKICGELPSEIVEFALMTNPKTMSIFFKSPTSSIGFGVRLLKLVAAVYCGLYLHITMENSKEKVKRSVKLDLFISQILLGSGTTIDSCFPAIIASYREWHEGLPQTILALPPIKQEIMSDVLQSKYLKNERPGNRLFADRAHKNVIEIIYDLIQALSFLKEISLKDAVMTYRDKKVNLFPFINYINGKLSIIISYDEKMNEYIYLCCHNMLEDRSFQKKDRFFENSLQKIAKRLGYEIKTDAGSIQREELNRPSTLSMLGGKLAKLDKLLEMMYANSDDSTIRDLWLVSELMNEANADTLIAKAREGCHSSKDRILSRILRKCLESDPVDVLEKTFKVESRDIELYIGTLSPDSHTAKEILGRVNAGAEREKKKLFDEIYSCAVKTEQVLPLRARLGAIEVLKLLGFDVKDYKTFDNISTYRQRLNAFKHYLGTEGWKPAPVRDAFLTIAGTIEAYLKNLIMFYNVLPFYEPDYAEGVSQSGIAKTEEIKKAIKIKRDEMEKHGIGRLIDNFNELSKDEAIQQALSRFLLRNGIWKPVEKEYAQHFKSLRQFNEKVRIPLAHREEQYEIKAEEAIEHIDNIIRFYKWLEGDRADLAYGYYQILPSIVTVGVKTTNSSNVTCIRYTLNYFAENDKQEHKSISLLTSQNIKIGCCYYALPCYGRASTELWVDPILISSDLFDDEN